MKFNKKIMQSLVVVFSAIFLMIVAVGGNKTTNEDVATVPRTAGVISQLALDKEEFRTPQLEVSQSEQVATPETEGDGVVSEESVLAEQEVASPWEGKLLVNVTKSLNVRAEASTEAEIVGKMFPGSGATILVDEGDWIKIQSGDVCGYVSREFCVFGDDAQALADELSLYYAIAQTDGLFVRSKPGTNGSLCTIINTNAKLKTVKDAETVEGWVPVEYNGKTAYVSADYVKLSMEYDDALTIAQYNEKVARERAAAVAAQAGPVTQQTASIAANVDDVTLLAALVWCEAGNQPYEGKLAVASVVCNRVRSGRFPNDLRSVIYQSGQFGPARSGKLANRLQVAQDASCIKAAQEALSGVDNVGGRLFFNNVRCGRSGLVIGDHVFW